MGKRGATGSTSVLGMIVIAMTSAMQPAKISQDARNELAVICDPANDAAKVSAMQRGREMLTDGWNSMKSVWKPAGRTRSADPGVSSLTHKSSSKANPIKQPPMAVTKTSNKRW